MNHTAYDDITAEGRLAALTVTVLLVLTGLGIAGASWDDVWERCGQIAGECVSRASSAVLLLAISVVMVGFGIVLARRVRRRPVDADGSSAWVWAVGAMFAVASFVIASRIPTFTCARGRLDDLLDLCMHPPSTSEPQRWVLAKQAIVVAGAIAAVAIVARPRWTRITAPATAVVWLGAMTWLVLETFVVGQT
ncbi:MAG TPA: hypothetical protein VEC15_03175 [Actinomycetota bacterium]|nr:hypothetical protein [Actinomycetota bacterium]